MYDEHYSDHDLAEIANNAAEAAAHDFELAEEFDSGKRAGRMDLKLELATYAEQSNDSRVKEIISSALYWVSQNE